VPPQTTISVVITDASVIINLCQTGHILLLGRTTTFEFVVTDEVIDEVTEPDQQRTLAEALTAGALRKESISSPEELTTFAELTQILGRGEAACLAVAEHRKWLVACDESEFFFGRLESVSAPIGHSTLQVCTSTGYGLAFSPLLKPTSRSEF
jgi:predicted nucleic acid-binding protein